MCGIHAVVSRHGATKPYLGLEGDHKRCLVNRGPDHLGLAEAHLLISPKQRLSIYLTSTVLSLRGNFVTVQPFRGDNDSGLFCWNGEAWMFDDQPVEGNDGEFIFAKLREASRRSNGEEEAIMGVLRSISGPFAFVYFDQPSSKIFYGRDRLGRRSLLVKDNPSELILSSVADETSQDWKEVDADGVYVLDLASYAESKPTASHTKRLPWKLEHNDDMVLSIGPINMSTPSEPPSSDDASSLPVQQLCDELARSLRLRTLNVPDPALNPSFGAARVAVLFSGGLDCTVLARLASDLIPADQAIDLLNVAFENPRVAQNRESDAEGTIYEACPDRVTGRKAFDELVSICPNRMWRFVAVDVPYTETVAHRSQVISLMHPHNTEMDLSIAYALYFAARGTGLAQEHPGGPSQPYTTSARVLLSGLGADELFGGYSRHQAAFERGGYAELAEELKLDVGRLGQRNLGRDDRAMAHWSREVRFPFLDEQFVEWAISLPTWKKCDFNIPGDDVLVEPGKRILRLLAEDLCLPSVAHEKKRAIQFGARTAKMESGRTKGTTLVTA